MGLRKLSETKSDWGLKPNNSLADLGKDSTYQERILIFSSKSETVTEGLYDRKPFYIVKASGLAIIFLYQSPFLPLEEKSNSLSLYFLYSTGVILFLPDLRPLV